MEKEIKIINKIIAEAVCHGADAGGSYDQNEYRTSRVRKRYKKCI